MLYLNPVISTEWDLLQDLYVHNVRSSVLHNKGMGVCDEVGLGPSQSTTVSVVHCGNGLTCDADTLVHTEGGTELFIG